MAAVPKLLGSAAASATTATDIISPSSPLHDGYTFAVTICNRNTSQATVRLGISATSATFENANYILYDYVVPAKGTLQVTGLAMEGTKYLIYYSDIASTNCLAYGVDVP